MYDLTHKLTIVDEIDYQRWIDGELIYDYDKEELVPLTWEIKKIKEENDIQEYITFEEFNDWSFLPYETFVQHFTTKNGDKVVAFGYVGYND